MFDRIVVLHALRSSWKEEKNPQKNQYYNRINGMDRIMSLLIYDIFGGEILKAPTKNGWHFYNRIDGNRIDFTHAIKSKSTDNNYIEDIPCSPEETLQIFEEEEYESHAVRFIRAYEKAIGLGKYIPNLIPLMNN
jgi:hypothetical protein